MEWSKSQKELKEASNKMTLKDYHRQQLLNSQESMSGDIDMDSENENENGDVDDSVKDINSTKTFVQEQEELKQAFKQALAKDNDEEDDQDDDTLFTHRPHTESEKRQHDSDYKSFLLSHLSTTTKNAPETFQTPSDPTESFLMQYLLTKGWVDPSAETTRTPTYEDIVKEEGLDEDDVMDDKVDMFEREYNFRFEEE
jgi:protein KRI1